MNWFRELVRKVFFWSARGLVKAGDDEFEIPVDCEKRAAMYPDTFEIPSKHERHNCIVGDGIKLIFESVRDWYEIKAVYEGLYRESLRQYRIELEGHPFWVGPKHICGIEPQLAVSQELLDKINADLDSREWKPRL